METQYPVVLNSDQKEEFSEKVKIIVVFGESYHIMLEFTQQRKSIPGIIGSFQKVNFQTFGENIGVIQWLEPIKGNEVYGEG